MGKNINEINGLRIEEFPDSIGGVSLDEQETVIVMGRSESIASVFTTDPTTWTKLKKMCTDASDKWKLTKVYDSRGEIYGVDVVCDKKCISFRSGATREYTDEERAAIAERFKRSQE